MKLTTLITCVLLVILSFGSEPVASSLDPVYNLQCLLAVKQCFAAAGLEFVPNVLVSKPDDPVVEKCIDAFFECQKAL